MTNANYNTKIFIYNMKVLGIGIDLVKNSRIEHVVTKNYAERFIKKFLHPR